MCGTDTGNKFCLPPSAPSGCSCRSIETQTPATVEDIEYSLDGLTCGGASRLRVAGTANGDAVRDAVRGAGYSFTTSK